MSLAINNNNLVYITDTDNNYYSAYGNKEGKHNPGIENLGHPFNENTYTNFLLIETASNLFAAVQGINTNLSTLFKWDYTSKSFVPLSYDNTSPFTNKEAISGIFTFPFTDDPEAVYVGGHSGFLYKLIPSQQSGKMHWVALNNGTPLGKKNTPSQIFDLVADPNGNLYSAAGKTGVWKIPTNSTSAVQIKGYDLPEYINTLVLAPPINKE